MPSCLVGLALPLAVEAALQRRGACVVQGVEEGGDVLNGHRLTLEVAAQVAVVGDGELGAFSAASSNRTFASLKPPVPLVPLVPSIPRTPGNPSTPSAPGVRYPLCPP